VVVDVDDDDARLQLLDPAVVANIDPTGRSLGEELAVELVSVDLDRRHVEFQPATPPTT
ncbi:MAG: hypothetical protein HKN26_09115, partial [Acidimicrobiales bacterium]|nr:hypothetical protein [Acidimicrobiales bacterium]